MKLSGEERIDASPAAVWAALIDPEVLRPLIPGCESMTGGPATGYDIAAGRSVAGLEVRLTGRVDLTQARPGEGCDLVASGTGGKAGGARGTARSYSSTVRHGGDECFRIGSKQRGEATPAN